MSKFETAQSMNKFEIAQLILQKNDIDGWLIISGDNQDIHSPILLGVKSHAKHFIYIDAKGSHVIMAVSMEAPMMRKSIERLKIDAKVIPYSSNKEILRLLQRSINKPRIALNFGENLFSVENSTAYADSIHAGDFLELKKLFPNTEFISAAPIIYGLRSVKTSSELNDFRNVCKATIEILESVPNWVKVGMTEKQVKKKLESEYLKIGEIGFEAIVGSGPNSADPHHNSSNKKLEPGVLLIDSGLIINQMCSDVTWTWWIGREPPEDFLNAYKALYEAKQIANRYYIDGLSTNIAPIKTRESLAENGYDHKKLYNHGLGHSLGYTVHDIGHRMSSKVPDKFKLKENMVYSNEPGLYWQGKWGIRLEDDIIIGKDKCEQLTYVSEEPIII